MTIRRNSDDRMRELARMVYASGGEDLAALTGLLRAHQRAGSIPPTTLVSDPDEVWIVNMTVFSSGRRDRREVRRETLCFATSREEALFGAVEHGVRAGRLHGWLYGDTLISVLRFGGDRRYEDALILMEHAAGGRYRFYVDGPLRRCPSRP